ncbi:MAG: hypothetical protein Q8P69_02290 [bacterium]|nr:hypothetical protein [bacterium]
MKKEKRVKNARIVNARLRYEQQFKELEKKTQRLQQKCKHPNARSEFDDQRYHVCDDCGKIW